MDRLEQNGCQLAVRIAETAIRQYRVLGKKGKPIAGREWTPLAAVVLVDRHGQGRNCGEGQPLMKVVALGTGSKCVGQQRMSKGGWVVNDSHAEVLARRAFCRYLQGQIEECVRGGEHSVMARRGSGRVGLKEQYSFHFFATQPPCGDACIFPVGAGGRQTAQGARSSGWDGWAEPSPVTEQHEQRGTVRDGAECLLPQQVATPDDAVPSNTMDSIISGSNTRDGVTIGSDTRGGVTNDSDTRGGVTNDSDTRGGVTNDSDTRGGVTSGSDTRGGVTNDSDTRGGVTIGSDTRGGVTNDSDTRGGVTIGSDTRGGVTNDSDTRGGVTIGSDTRGGVTIGSDTRGGEPCESFDVPCAKRLKHGPPSPPQPADIHRTGARCTVRGECDPHLPGVGYHLIGALRTKPGRGDPTLSMACSDKMLRWNVLGCQGGLLAGFLDCPLYFASFTFLDTLFDKQAVRRALWGRLSPIAEALVRDEEMRGRGYRLNQADLHVVRAREVLSQEELLCLVPSDLQRPAPGGVCWCAEPPVHEVVVQGVKQGASTRQEPSRSSGVFVCKARRLEDFKGLLASLPDDCLSLCLRGRADSHSYKECKKLDAVYCRARALFMQFCPSWIENSDEYERFK